MKNINKIIILLICSLQLYGCNIPFKFPLGLPTPNNLMNHAPKGPPDFQYGWENGCETGSAQLENSFYSDMRTVWFKKDFQYAEEHPDYEVGWQMGFWYCLRLSERRIGFSDSKSIGF